MSDAPKIIPGLADVPVAESAVSFIDGKRARLEYRGLAVEALARQSSFEETCWLLLKGELPTQRELAGFDEQLRHHRRLKFKIIDLLKCLPETGHPMGALQAGDVADWSSPERSGWSSPERSGWSSPERSGRSSVQATSPSPAAMTLGPGTTAAEAHPRFIGKPARRTERPFRLHFSPSPGTRSLF